MLSGVWAGTVVGSSEPGGLPEYEEKMKDSYARYLADWLAYYDLEQRWPTSKFWSRRHKALEQLFE